jgi:hypothetical protein
LEWPENSQPGPAAGTQDASDADAAEIMEMLGVIDQTLDLLDGALAAVLDASLTEKDTRQ